ncbi:hypothetical protein L2X99_14420 [Microbacterium sp. KUDC0406]|uniref:hypothetical protein n=1 Tax=Microbacterium sp. KUDC0406 TaxID=2909588 RepID=UPI001F2D7787|nr:hypothetical protein [Microbacterium sp. KUDC0406]UJP09598.1 hypothetical protein L2X99_14420 [Microbacterium sp. KUDC0406]
MSDHKGVSRRLLLAGLAGAPIAVGAYGAVQQEAQPGEAALARSTVDETTASATTDHRKRIHLKLDRAFDGFADAVAAGGVNSYFPQGFSVDEEENELYVSYSAVTSATTKPLCYVVFDFETGATKRWFLAGAGGYAQSFSIVRRAGVKWLVAVHKYQQSIGRYDITAAATGSTVQPESVFTVDCTTDVCVTGDYAYVSTAQRRASGPGYKSVTMVYDWDFTPRAQFEIPMMSNGNFYTGKMTPKRQSFWVGPGFIAAGYGRGEAENDTHGYDAIGCVLFGPDGGVRRSSLHKRALYRTVFETMEGASPTTRMENEGVWVSKAGDVFTLQVGGGDKMWMYLVQEFCGAGAEATDFSSSAMVLGNNARTDAYYPVPTKEGMIRHPLTGALVSTSAAVARLMREIGVVTLGFSTVEFSGMKQGSAAFPAKSFVEFTMWGEREFDYTVTSATAIKRYHLTLDAAGEPTGEVAPTDARQGVGTDSGGLQDTALGDGLYEVGPDASGAPKGKPFGGVLQRIVHGDGDLINLLFGAPGGENAGKVFIQTKAEAGSWSAWRAFTTEEV